MYECMYVYSFSLKLGRNKTLCSSNTTNREVQSVQRGTENVYTKIVNEEIMVPFLRLLRWFSALNVCCTNEKT